jgi:hypothetical protein
VIPSGVYHDARLGTHVPGNPIRAALAELEFIENTTADTWFNGEGAGERVLRLSEDMTNVFLRDLKTQP